MNKILATDGKGTFYESSYDRPKIKKDEIAVKALITGVCRSDIDMMQGNFGPLPLNMQGHEGIGQVIEKGTKIKNVEIGDIVATRGEPAYADEYNVRKKEYVKVPEAHPKYILEPVACGINIVEQAKKEISKRSGKGNKLLILGSGFLSWVAYHTLMIKKYDFEIHVVGNNNQNIWGDILISQPETGYDVIIDLSDKSTIFEEIIYNENALIVIGSQKTITTNFESFLWRAITVIFPSPRNTKFIKCMQLAEKWITANKINIDIFWSKSYNRNTEWQQAFEDGVNRPKNYSRGYISWL